MQARYLLPLPLGTAEPPSLGSERKRSPISGVALIPSIRRLSHSSSSTSRSLVDRHTFGDYRSGLERVGLIGEPAGTTLKATA